MHWNACYSGLFKPLLLTWLTDCLTAWQLDCFVPTEQLMSKCLLTGGIKGEVITKVTASHGACGFSSVLPSRLLRGKTPPKGEAADYPWAVVSPLGNTSVSSWSVVTCSALLMHGQQNVVLVCYSLEAMVLPVCICISSITRNTCIYFILTNTHYLDNSTSSPGIHRR